MPKDPYVIKWTREPESLAGPGFYLANVRVPNITYPLTFVIDHDRTKPDSVWELSISVTDVEGKFFTFDFERLDLAKKFATGFMALLKLVKH